jgi:phosphopantetheinyl transferase
MALVFKEHIAMGTLLGVWKKEEELELLHAVFPLRSEEIADFKKISNVTRQKEWLTTRVLLTEMLQKRRIISYSEHGKPFINESNLNLSISHSRNFVAIIISSQYYPGVDIEQVSERVANVNHKFLNDTEREWCTSLPLMTACWSAKEAVFKIFERELDFHDMVVEPFQLEPDKGQFEASIIKTFPPARFKIKYRFFDNDILTYTLKRPDLLIS